MEWSEELAGGLLQAAPDAILVIDGDRIVLVNDRAEQVYGWPRSELVGRSVDVLMTDASRALRAERRQVMTESPPGSIGTIRTTACRKDGTEFPVESSTTLVETPQGRLAVAVVRDITERLGAEEERARLRAEAQAHRSQRLESLGQLAGGIAHDFNNMLGVILNYANFVIEEAESAEPDVSMIAADAKQVVKAGQRGTDLTHQLLAFARREVVRPQALDLNALVGGVRELLCRTLGDHVRLILRLEPGLPSVTCDPAQMEQMLVHLALNARDAMPSGGNLVIDTGRQDDQVRLRVADTGRGMDAGVLDRAFEPFYTTKGSAEGAGLGLATVYGIVTQAGGEVAITSELGFGTTVTVLLPAGAEPAPEQLTGDQPVTEGHGETLLVVEDEDALRDVAGRILSGAGYRVLSAEGGRQALDLAARHDGEIDLLVSDVVMPGMLGKELAERLMVVRPSTRVLYMSGYAQPVLASEGTLDPGVALLEKPFTANDLLTAVRKRLDG
ncbi:putative multi-sensor signal transduction histidine kinase [Actinoplanes missouriensis 431]|uniref:histidine kinase n=1 Tax=Actinoplanes missouriensis (strain ATCC 14538 / DSM 43046 / CBS 188.64 / JCM 3121 / NBRC 102363 / NCIMB 12654 / NRRL B-3342 / UNCC 431) TaxID=512565 RepID=I0H033_ACTM4|nr:ATP-binding protein [Actinoplanes missouriensis]BAL86370.1 putative multi-sensor signal transduction histidine kinase [Actinoplanes missouriensis 431]